MTLDPSHSRMSFSPRAHDLSTFGALATAAGFAYATLRTAANLPLICKVPLDDCLKSKTCWNFVQSMLTSEPARACGIELLKTSGFILATVTAGGIGLYIHRKVKVMTLQQNSSQDPIAEPMRPIMKVRFADVTKHAIPLLGFIQENGKIKNNLTEEDLAQFSFKTVASEQTAAQDCVDETKGPESQEDIDSLPIASLIERDDSSSVEQSQPAAVTSTSPTSPAPIKEEAVVKQEMGTSVKIAPLRTHQMHLRSQGPIII